MPDLISVVVLSETERHALADSCAAARAKAVGDEITASLKAGDKELKALTTATEVSRTDLDTAKALLQRRLAHLDSLPQGEAQSMHRQNVAEALSAVEAGLALY